MLSEEGVVDVIVFGSSVRGKLFPNDVDVFVLVDDGLDFENKSRISAELEKKGFNSVVMSYSESFRKGFWWSLIHEGRSLKNGDLRGFLGLKSIDLFLFRHRLSGSEKITFYRALNSLEGILKNGGGVLFCSVENSGEVEEFFENWGVEFLRIPIQMSENFATPLKMWFGSE
jgi:predicted nucleotidyltransferase